MIEKNTVTGENVGKRLDLFASLAFPQFSRTNVRKFLAAGKIKVNGKVEYRPNYKVNEADEVELDTDVVTQKKHVRPYELEVEIVYQDEDIVVVNKPVGLPVHPASNKETKTLLNALYYCLKDSITAYGVNLVNRIDKETSGLVVTAISPRGAWHYSRLFETGQIEKEYLAVVSAQWMRKYGDEVVNAAHNLRYDGSTRRQMVDERKGEYAVTEFSLLNVNEEEDKALLWVKPKTGRTHQIRVQLAALGFPIIGDTKYGGEPGERLLLHSWRLKLQHVSGERDLQLEASIPAEFSF